MRTSQNCYKLKTSLKVYEHSQRGEGGRIEQQGQIQWRLEKLLTQERPRELDMIKFCYSLVNSVTTERRRYELFKLSHETLQALSSFWDYNSQENSHFGMRICCICSQTLILIRNSKKTNYETILFIHALCSYFKLFKNKEKQFH